MEVEKLELLDFRNYESAHVQFAGGFNLVVGGNGQGKTNLLEAVHVACGLGSHRTSTAAPLVRTGSERAVIRMRTLVGTRQVAVDAEVRASGGTRLLLNRSPWRGSGPGTPTAVLFSPDDLAIVKGGPEERRRFLDQASASLKPVAAADRLAFERVLRQRNAALKAVHSNPGALETLDVWSERLVEAASMVVWARVRALRLLAPSIERHYRSMAKGGEEVSASYLFEGVGRVPGSLEETAEDIRSVLPRLRSREIDRGVTLVGPHRDDMLISLGDAEARLYASQGEQRTLALALRVAQKDLIAEVRGEDPILLLDDVFSELDDRRRAELAELVGGSQQAIATTASPGGLPVIPSRSLVVEEGKVRD